MDSNDLDRVLDDFNIEIQSTIFDGLAFGVCRFPMNKRPSLYVRDGNVHTPCASFSSVEMAKKFIDVLEIVLNMNKQKILNRTLKESENENGETQLG